MDRVISPVNSRGFDPLINVGREGGIPQTDMVVVIQTQACKAFPSELQACLPLYGITGCDSSCIYHIDIHQ